MKFAQWFSVETKKKKRSEKSKVVKKEKNRVKTKRKR
jgi:hypothetical protein